ncbi:MAG TPA: DUF2784 family protein [Caulobacteraceae bacterium]|jgi:hypothetical protein
MLAATILTVHLAIIAFNVFGLVAVPVGAWRGWRFVYEPVWRLAHVACLALVAVQAVAGKACFLTVWQDEANGTASRTPLIMGFVNHVLFWRLPIWVFAAGYLAIFAYALALLSIVPLRRR